MGVRMAENLVRAGHDVTVWNRSSEKARAFADAHGAQMAETPRDLAENTEIVLTMLADDAASQAVHERPDGLFAASGGAGLIVEMGTMSPGHIAELCAQAPDDITVFDAPVSGATQAAADGRLMIMAGADETMTAPAMPLFDAMGTKTICLGTPGAGAVMKLAVNMLIHGLNQTVSEALGLAEAAGIATDRAFDAIEASAAAAPMLGYRRPLYLDETGHDVTFTVDLAKKDMTVTTELADRLGVAVPQAMLNLEKLSQASAEGYGARDMASIFNFMRKERP